MREKQLLESDVVITMRKVMELSPEIAEELRLLALLPDDEIDLSDAPEVIDWSKSERAKFFSAPVIERGYDVRSIANWIMQKLWSAQIEVSNLYLNKIVYFVIERSLVERCILLSPARIEAWEHGPVFREIYQNYKGRDDKAITDLIRKFSVNDRAMQVAKDEFDMQDVEFFESVCSTFSNLSASRLRNLSHIRGGPWDRVWVASRKKNPGMVITPEVILAHAPLERLVDAQ